MTIEFSVKILGEVHKTQDLTTIAQWRKKGRLVLCREIPDKRFYRPGLWMERGKNKKKIKVDQYTADTVLKLYKKGYRIVTDEVKKQEKRGERFRNILQEVAEVLEPTNAQKAAYFRNATPYQHDTSLAVDYPTKGNSLKHTVEQFKADGKPHGVITLYHGTRLQNIPSIVKCGIKRGRSWGMLGRGVYLGQMQKALNYTDLVVLECQVVLGKCKELVKIEKLGVNSDYDSLHAPPGKLQGVNKGFLFNEEWIVRLPNQVEISRLVCTTK